MRLLKGLVPVLAAALLAGCSSFGRWEEQPPATTGAPAPRPPPARPRSQPVPESHVVRSGETLFGIAFRYGLSVQDLARWNNLGDGTLIVTGQRLRLSPGTGKPPTSAAGGVPAAPSEPAPRWQWPVAGPVLARYGESPMTASGVQIGGQAGDDVRAAAGGQVVYAGSGLVGYGELLIIKHSPSWLSAYGYNQVLLVREGQQVAAGQTIARMGEGPVGAGRRPALHFEIRRNGAPLDPLTALPVAPRN